MVTVRFTLTRSELFACHRRLHARRWHHWVYVGFGIAIAILGALASSAAWAIGGAAYALLYVVGVGWIAPWIAWRRIPQVRREQLVSVSDRGILTAMNNASTSSDWTFWRKVSLIADVYVVHARTRGYCVIPRRAFDAPDEEREFRALVAEHIRASAL